LQAAGTGQQTPEFAQIIRSKAPWRLTLLFCDRHCRTASVLPPLRPLGRLTSVNQAGGRFIPIYIVRNLQKIILD
jgi:hypothetical protein